MYTQEELLKKVKDFNKEHDLELHPQFIQLRLMSSLGYMSKQWLKVRGDSGEATRVKLERMESTKEVETAIGLVLYSLTSFVIATKVDECKYTNLGWNRDYYNYLGCRNVESITIGMIENVMNLYMIQVNMATLIKFDETVESNLVDLENIFKIYTRLSKLCEILNLNLDKCLDTALDVHNIK